MVNRLNSSATCLAPFKMKRVRIPASASWLISEIKRLMRERDPQIKGIAVSTKDQTKWIKYKKIKNQVNYSIIVCKKDYYHSYFESNIGKIKGTWNGINSLLYICQERKPKPRFRSWLLMTKTSMIRITFNSYFTEIAPTLGLASKINPPRVSFWDFIKPSHTNFELIASTVDEVSWLVANLSTNKADGLDRIPARLPKASCPLTAPSLANVLQGWL